MKVTVWKIGSWKVLYSIDVNNDFITKCNFIGLEVLAMGSSVGRIPGAIPTSEPPKIKTELWNFKQKSCKPMDKTEMCSLYTTATRAPTYHIKWFLPTGSATVVQWDETNVQEVADVQYCVRGLRDITDVVACGNSLVFVSGSEMRSYNINDLEVGILLIAVCKILYMVLNRCGRSSNMKMHISFCAILYLQFEQ